MATFTHVQPPPGQPMFVPPGTAPVGPPTGAPGTVMYYPQAAGGTGAIILVTHMPDHQLILAIHTVQGSPRSAI